MSLRRKILVIFAGGLIAGFALFGWWAADLLRQSYGRNAEEMMVDISHLLATTVEQESRDTNGGVSPEGLARLFDGYKARRVTADIFGLKKVRPELDVYVMNAAGIVLFSSENPADVGRDFSTWRDVRRTLAGGYGARSTRSDPTDRRTSAFYVAAPIHGSTGQIIGSLSIIKRRTTVTSVVERAVFDMLWLALLVIGLMILMATLLFHWITLPLGHLEAYARSISAGRQTPLPRLRGREVAALGRAFEEMRVAVEGKKEIERMATALSHELKSPLAGIQGAAELLQEPSMDPARKERFLANIVGESQRAREIVERLLEVTALEARSALDRNERVSLNDVVQVAIDGLLGLYSPRGIRVAFTPAEGTLVDGDPFLLRQAIRNVLQNAIEFSPDDGEVRVWIEHGGSDTRLCIEDDGPGVPEFAKDRVFEKFFSLERPSTRRKGSGLGLSFVTEVMALHGGRVRLETIASADRHGARAQLSWPLRTAGPQ